MTMYYELYLSNFNCIIWLNEHGKKITSEIGLHRQEEGRIKEGRKSWFDIKRFPIDSSNFLVCTYFMYELKRVSKLTTVTTCCTAKIEGRWIIIITNYTIDLLQHRFQLWNWSIMYFCHNTSFPNFSAFSGYFCNFWQSKYLTDSSNSTIIIII